MEKEEVASPRKQSRRESYGIGMEPRPETIELRAFGKRRRRGGDDRRWSVVELVVVAVVVVLFGSRAAVGLVWFDLVGWLP